MNGRLAEALPFAWQSVFRPLAAAGPPDLFNELIRAVWRATPPPSPLPAFPINSYDDQGNLVDPNALAQVAAREALVKSAADNRAEYEAAVSGANTVAFFKKLLRAAKDNEASAISFFERCFDGLENFDVSLQERFKQLGHRFISKYNLRYEIHGGFVLHATISGIFGQLLAELRVAASQNAHTQALFGEFEEAFRDLRLGRSEARLKACLLREFNLLEGLGRVHPSVNHHTLGQICDDLDWPHATIKDVGKKLYGFRSDYPGVGHAGNPNSVLRPITTKDFVSISLMLAAISPYFVAQIDGERCYVA